MLSPIALNQFRVGYSRRDLNQTSLQNGGINVPGLPANSFSSVSPIFTVAGYQLNPPNPTGSFGFTTTGTNSPTVTGSGNAFASLLLGRVNAFNIYIQRNAIQPRAHIAEFFVGDHWRVLSRLTLNIGTPYTLNFPSTEVHNQGAVFNLGTQVLDFPHTSRELECCDFGPRLGDVS